ncbi:MAG: hypothetical protein K6G15_01150, partial [Desulfovibrio sp.]|nr:hypothetical protein [Desulfovibrio sp.]
NIKIYLNSKEIYNNKIKDKRKLILDIKELTLKHTNELKFILKDAHAPSKIDRRLLGIEFYDLLLSYT